MQESGRTERLDFPAQPISGRLYLVIARRNSRGGRRRRLERQGVKRAAHGALKGFIDNAVLFHAALAPESLRNDDGGVMVAVPRKIVDRYFRVGQPFSDKPLDILHMHGHMNYPSRIL
jgi:hypothetical protein